MTEQRSLRDLIYSLDGDLADLPFWEGCARGEFLLMRCNDCERYYWPAAHCVHHGGRAMEWVAATGRGTVHVYTIVRRGESAATGQKAPYAVAVVELEEGPFYHTNIVGIGFDEVCAGIAVAVEFMTHANGMTVPIFRPVST